MYVIYCILGFVSYFAKIATSEIYQKILKLKFELHNKLILVGFLDLYLVEGYQLNKYVFNSDTKELFICDKKINFSNLGFKLESEIGSGRNGIVLKGQHTLLNRPVAIKFWLPYRDRDKTPDFNKFRNEIRKLALLDSDKIVTIYHADVIENDYFFAVYEFVQGESLKEWLKREQDFDSRNFVLEQIYEEMEEVHKIGIYHGDLHEENVLIKSDLHVKIIDFGTSFFAKTKDDSHQREAELLLNTGLSILKPEDTKYKLLEIDILKTSPPECVPPAMLMLSKVIQEFNRISELDKESDDESNDGWNDYTQRGIIFSLSILICESPFFNLERIIELLQSSNMSDKFIDFFVSVTNSESLSCFCEEETYNIVPMRASRENINLLKLSYIMLRTKYLKKFGTINTTDI